MNAVRRCLVFSFFLAFCSIGASVDAQSMEGIYRLNDAASYQSGCFPPCKCPLYMPMGTVGAMQLIATENADVYVVSDINWLVGQGDDRFRVAGNGTYTLDTQPPATQRLELDLVIDENAFFHFDSGWVSLQAVGTAGVDITVTKNNYVCNDIVIQVSASRVPAAELRRYTLGRTTEYQEGCWPPCYCPIYMPSPTRGRFLLVPLSQGPLFDEYSVVNASWRIESVPPPGSNFVTGSGFYRIGGEVEPQQQLQLWLSFGDGDPIAFDSGLGFGGHNFPNIDIDISRNGFYCWDQVFYMHARPVRFYSAPAYELDGMEQ